MRPNHRLRLPEAKLVAAASGGMTCLGRSQPTRLSTRASADVPLLWEPTTTIARRAGTGVGGGLWPISTARPSNSSFNSTVPLSIPILRRCRERRPPAAPERLDAERRPPEPAPPHDNTCWKIQPATECRPSMESHTHPGRICADPGGAPLREILPLPHPVGPPLRRATPLSNRPSRSGRNSSEGFDEQQVRSGRVDGAPDRALGDAQALTLDRTRGGRRRCHARSALDLVSLRAVPEEVALRQQVDSKRSLPPGLSHSETRSTVFCARPLIWAST